MMDVFKIITDGVNDVIKLFEELFNNGQLLLFAIGVVALFVIIMIFTR